MNIEDRAFFIAAGKSLEQVEEWHRTVKAGIDAALAWSKEIGAAHVSYDRRSGSIAMKFPDGKAPKGWAKHPRDRDWHIPSGARTPAAKAVRARASALRPSLVPGHEHIGPASDGRTYWFSPILQNLGGKWVIGQHKECKEAPPDAIPIKRSEYMAMVEEQEAAAVA